ncbi:hypothetical protein M408DRAFT_283643 [Serendipita vermifera MAFF 305830]|uniref:Uncharacterized protein n=1 Tax=Serendipita vermifera MAFF 305830 TaxID=933852 RepID=A0A0C2W7S9_SERVB|nr:hypothetical protein M408DRAFT_283643 [Serendipita vermifera MAFF 305830]
MDTAPTSQGFTWGAHSIVFYAKDLLEGQQHTLVMSVAPSDVAWYLDYLIYRTKNTTSVSAIEGPPRDRGTPASKIGAIVEGVLGGVFLISLVFLGICLFKRRSQGASVSRRKTSAPYNGGGDTRSIRSVQSMGGSINESSLAFTRTPSSILKNSGSFGTAGERPRIRISEGASGCRISVRTLEARHNKLLSHHRILPLQTSNTAMVFSFPVQAVQRCPRLLPCWSGDDTTYVYSL